MENELNIKIEKILVEGLFGSFDYLIQKKSDSSNDKLMLLYGDNGSGKTTILKLVFYLLSTSENSGHKSAIANIKFKRISISLSNNIRISAIRDIVEQGSYKYIIDKHNEETGNDEDPLYEFDLKAIKEDNKNFSIRFENPKEDEYYNSMLRYLANLNIRLFFLSDSRKSQNTGVLNISEEFEREYNQTSNELEKIYLRNKFKKNDDSDLINFSIKSLEIYFKSEIINASKIGEQENNNIYLQIVKQINAKITNDEILKGQIEDLREILSEVNQRTDSYARFGLVSSTEYSQIQQALSAAGDKQEIIFNILEPFIRGLKAKLDALKAVQEQLSNFIGCLNSFLSYKSLNYSINGGFKVVQDKTNEPIDFNDLSSGEKQLVMLFSNAILANSQATIFIIDEPEISLNIKWQRKIIEYLVQMTPNHNIQFLIATHSIELLSNQKGNIVKLENIKEWN